MMVTNCADVTKNGTMMMSIYYSIQAAS